MDHLSVKYTGPDGEFFPALGPLSLTIYAGEFVCLVGPSGCGKSTLIRVIAGLQAQTEGSVLLDGMPVEEPSPRIGLMFQDANLMPWRTVRDNIGLPLELAGVNKQERYQIVHDMLPALALEDFADAYPGELSGGMAQRVALGRVLIQKPDVLLLDEPMGALDALTREKISIDLLRVWRQEKQTVLMVTHDINEAVLLADRVLVMSRRPGRIIADIPVLLPRPRSLEDTYHDAFGQVAKDVRAA
ncbi:MAG: ABC transporter ATP-binding protein, partial [Chloroflexi bacterium]